MRRIHNSLDEILTIFDENPKSKEINNRLKIELHSMKGLLDAVGFNNATETVVEIEEMTHALGETADPALMGIIKGSVEKIEEMLRLLESKGEHSISEIDNKVSFESLLVKAGKRMNVEIEIDDKKSMLSSRAISIINGVKKIAELHSAVPSEEDLIADAKFDVLKLDITTHESKDEIQEKLEKMPKVKSVLIFAGGDRAGETASEELFLRVRLRDVRSIGNDLTILAGQMGQLETHLDSQGLEILETLYNSIENIQDDIGRLKSVPFIQILSGLPGMVSRIAKQEKKLVEFSMQGRFIRVDKLVANAILDPITQIIRNAVSHGIEGRAERRKLKKSPIGSINLTASEVRDKIIIKVTDDGAGIDPVLLKKRAKELGIEITSENIIDVMFQNKFTTHSSDTSISGRGIGLYTAKKRIEDIGGTINVSSELGKGTVFTLEIPNSDSLLKSIIVRSGNIKFAISSFDIEHIEVIREEISMYHFIDKEIPVVKMSEVIHSEEEREQKILIVCRGAKGYYALVVDAIVDERLASIKPLNPLLSNLEVFDGTLFDEKQEPILVLNTSAII